MKSRRLLIEPINVSCSGLDDGGIVVEVVGGNPDYTFDWNVDVLDGQQNPSGLIAGNYSLTVTDLNACDAVLNVTIDEPSSLILESELTEVSCFENQNGSIDVSITGGTMPYTFDWNNGTSIEEDLINIGAGEYELIVTDANACSQTTSFILENPDAIQVDIEEVSNYNGFNVSCNGESDAYVSLAANGGNAPYEFVWEDGTISAEQLVQNLK